MLLEHWPWIIGLLSATALLFTVRWVEVDKKPGHRLRPELSLLGVILLSVLFVRSNASGIPQGPHDAMRMHDASETAAALNGAYSALHGLQNTHGKLHRQPLDWITAQEAESNLQTLYPAPRPIPEQAQGRPINLFLVFLESWSTRHMQPLEDGTPVTPNFDALAARAFTDRDMIAGGMRTTEGMFAVLCSYQNPLGQTLARTPQALFDYDCLPRRLAEAGWSTAYFQGSHENTSGVGAYAQSMGYALSEGKESISRRDYPENNWGVYDHDLYRHVLRALSEMPEPVHIGINTNTTHDIQLREDFAPLVAPDSRLNIERNVLHLADHELGEFVSALKKRDWHYPWMLVLVADHTARVRRTGVERHQVPFAIYAPDLVEPGTPGRIAHHRDIAPTIAEILDMPMPYTLGYSLFDESAPQIAEYYHNGTLGWFVGDDQVIEIPLAEPQQARCHNWRRNPELDNPQPCRNGANEQIRRAYSLTKKAQEHLFDNQALSLAPVEPPAEHQFTAR